MRANLDVVDDDAGSLIAEYAGVESLPYMTLTSRQMGRWVNERMRKYKTPLSHFHREFKEFYKHDAKYFYLPEDINRDDYINVVTETGTVIELSDIASDCKMRNDKETYDACASKMLPLQERLWLRTYRAASVAEDREGVKILYLPVETLERIRDIARRGQTVAETELPSNLVESLNAYGCVFFGLMNKFQTVTAALRGHPFQQLQANRQHFDEALLQNSILDFFSKRVFVEATIDQMSREAARVLARNVLAVLFKACIACDNFPLWQRVSTEAANRFNRGSLLYTIEDGEYRSALDGAVTRASAIRFLYSIIPNRGIQFVPLTGNTYFLPFIAAILAGRYFGMSDVYNHVAIIGRYTDDPYRVVTSQLDSILEASVRERAERNGRSFGLRMLLARAYMKEHTVFGPLTLHMRHDRCGLPYRSSVHMY